MSDRLDDPRAGRMESVNPKAQAADPQEEMEGLRGLSRKARFRSGAASGSDLSRRKGAVVPGLKFGQHLGYALFQLFSGFELHDGTGRDRNGGIGFVRITPDLWPRLRYLKGPEIPEHDIIVGGQTGGHLLDEALHDAEYLLLG